MTTSAPLIIEQGHVGMFGYGSLLCRSSMELTLGQACQRPPVPCSLAGWQRTWDVIMPNTSFYERLDEGEFVPENIVYLNITPSSSAPVNGLLYILTEQEVEAFDRREWIYHRTNVNASIREIQVQGGDVYTYVAKPEAMLDARTTRAWAAIRSTYLDIISDGLMQLGPEFTSRYQATTEAVPEWRVFKDVKRLGSHPLLAEAKSSAGPRLV